VRELLYSEFGLRPPDERETQSGEPPVDKDALHELLSRPLPENVVELLEGLLAYRRAEKMLSTYVVGSEKKPLYFDPLGRVHPTWSPHSARTGRLSAQNPAVQTIPATKLDTDSLRSMYIAGPGNVLVYADMAQIEARLITLFAQDEVWGRAFKEKRDIHRLNAVTFFNSAKTPLKYEQIDKGDYRRDFAKTLVYMYSYGGGALRAMKNMRLVRDPRTGERKYARFSLRESKAARRALLRDHPALEKWWDETMEEFRLKGELRGLIHDRASYFLDCEAGNADEEDRSQIVNFRIQCTAAAIVDEWCRLLMEEIGWSWYGKLRGLGGPGICFQGHDSVMLEVKANQAERAKILLEETSKRVLEWRGMKMDFFAELKVGQRWSILG
jgi:DNA polymerase I-like protein with 3'-5' exonuclease and polymerase domains